MGGSILPSLPSREEDPTRYLGVADAVSTGAVLLPAGKDNIHSHWIVAGCRLAACLLQQQPVDVLTFAGRSALHSIRCVSRAQPAIPHRRGTLPGPLHVCGGPSHTLSPACLHLH